MSVTSIAPAEAVEPVDQPLDGPVDVVAAQRAAADLLVALGADPESESLRDTPRRIAAAYAELLSARSFAPTSFPNDGDYSGPVVVSGIPFTSLCEHHLLPFIGQATVGYLPGARLLGLSKLAHVVEHFARRLQVQERMTAQIAHWLDDELAPEGVGVIVSAEHSCMTMRGAKARGATTTTSMFLGQLRDDPAARAAFREAVGTVTG